VPFYDIWKIALRFNELPAFYLLLVIKLNIIKMKGAANLSLQPLSTGI